MIIRIIIHGVDKLYIIDYSSYKAITKIKAFSVHPFCFFRQKRSMILPMLRINSPCVKDPEIQSIHTPKQYGILLYVELNGQLLRHLKLKITTLKKTILFNHWSTIGGLLII